MPVRLAVAIHGRAQELPPLGRGDMMAALSSRPSCVRLVTSSLLAAGLVGCEMLFPLAEYREPAGTTAETDSSLPDASATSPDDGASDGATDGGTTGFCARQTRDGGFFRCFDFDGDGGAAAIQEGKLVKGAGVVELEEGAGVSPPNAMVVRFPSEGAGVPGYAYLEVRWDAVPKRVEVEFKARSEQVYGPLATIYLLDPAHVWNFSLGAQDGVAGLEQTPGPVNYEYPTSPLDTSVWHRYEVTVSFEEKKLWVRVDGTQDVYIGEPFKVPAASLTGATFATLDFGWPYRQGPAAESRIHYDDIVVRSFP